VTECGVTTGVDAARAAGAQARQARIADIVASFFIAFLPVRVVPPL
jgi:hypothetical protein